MKTSIVPISPRFAIFRQAPFVAGFTAVMLSTLTDELHAYLSPIAIRRGNSLNDLVNSVLPKELAIVETLN